ncbi:MAG TPA: hypothetical protein VFP59_06120 [Candidatus Angelobacter sp.]|nr:hypothetical protein [Candidatus Angelobacter sp.]
MLPEIKIGMLMVADRLPLPSSCGVKTLPFCSGWSAVLNIEADNADRRFNDMGWSCFQKDSAGSVNLIGFGNVHTLTKAFKKIVRHQQSVKFNCLEITAAVQKSFMGVSYVHLSARARNIRQRLW